jgi:hypothetical protein
MQDGTQRDWQRFHAFAIAVGFAACVVFILAGVLTRLEMFGDGSIFSYAVAAQLAWDFHWHNISGRLFTYLYAYVVPQQLVALTGSARAGIAAYGTLFLSAPLFGLLAMAAAVRSPSRSLLVYACLSTALLCPFVYGAPTEMWMAQALFWPALSLSVFAPLTASGAAAVLIALLALVFTHEGAIVLALSILFALYLRGGRDPRFLRALIAFGAAMLIWAAVKLTLQPDAYIASVIHDAAFKFIDIRNLAQPAFLTILSVLAAYALLIASIKALGIGRPRLLAFAICSATLAIFWLWFDHWVLSEARYDIRTVLLIGIPILGVLASLQTMTAEEWDGSPLSFLRNWFKRASRLPSPSALAGALALVLLVHAVETVKFVYEWTQYKAAVRTLATGTNADPQLGSELFVSSERIAPDLNRLGWNSTTPFLSVLVAPDLTPSRLVVDPSAGYFWLSCATATESERTSTALPEQARRLIRLHACLHRSD